MSKLRDPVTSAAFVENEERRQRNWSTNAKICSVVRPCRCLRHGRVSFFVPKYDVYKLSTDSLICYYPVFYWGIFLDLAAIGGRICIRKQDLWLQSGQMDARICSKTDNVFLISHAISSSSPEKRHLDRPSNLRFFGFWGLTENLTK